MLACFIGLADELPAGSVSEAAAAPTLYKALTLATSACAVLSARLSLWVQICAKRSRHALSLYRSRTSKAVYSTSVVGLFESIRGMFSKTLEEMLAYAT